MTCKMGTQSMITAQVFHLTWPGLQHTNNFKTKGKHLMAPPRKAASDEFAHLHIEVEQVILDEVRRLNPGYGNVSSLIRRLLKEYLRHVRQV